MRALAMVVSMGCACGAASASFAGVVTVEMKGTVTVVGDGYGTPPGPPYPSFPAVQVGEQVSFFASFDDLHYTPQLHLTIDGVSDYFDVGWGSVGYGDMEYIYNLQGLNLTSWRVETPVWTFGAYDLNSTAAHYKQLPDGSYIGWASALVMKEGRVVGLFSELHTNFNDLRSSGSSFNFGISLPGYRATYAGIWDVTGAVVKTAAPEPTTWALMLLGFGTVGARLRRGRRVACSISRS